MNLKSLSISVVFFLTPVLSQAVGNERGNGGDAVVCRDSQGHIKSAELFDYFESETVFGAHIVNDDSVSVSKYFDQAIATLGTYDADFFEPKVGTDSSGISLALVLEAFDDLSQSRASSLIHLVRASKLVDISDIDAYVLPTSPRCKIEQAAIYVNAKNGGPFFYVQEEIYRHLAARDVKGLVLHEILNYVLADRLVGKNSTSIRRLNSEIAETTPNNFSFLKYVELRSQWNLPYPANRWMHVSGLALDFTTYISEGQEPYVPMGYVGFRDSNRLLWVFDAQARVNFPLTNKAQVQ
jgi:hypothetical protein